MPFKTKAKKLSAYQKRFELAQKQIELPSYESLQLGKRIAKDSIKVGDRALSFQDFSYVKKEVILTAVIASLIIGVQIVLGLTLL